MNWFLVLITIFVVLLFFYLIKSKLNRNASKSSIDNINDIPIQQIPLKDSLTGEILIVEMFRFNRKMDWNLANEACQNLGDEWRMPTIPEFELLLGDGALTKWFWSYAYAGYYWSSTLSNEDGKAFIARVPPKYQMGFSMIADTRSPYSVIAIRTIKRLQ